MEKHTIQFLLINNGAFGTMEQVLEFYNKGDGIGLGLHCRVIGHMLKKYMELINKEKDQIR